jgi:hypothetical protein
MADKPGITVGMVQDCLAQVLAQIKKLNAEMAETFANEVSLYEVIDNQIHFLTTPALKERFEKPQPKKALDKAFSASLGRRVSVHFFATKLPKLIVKNVTTGDWRYYTRYPRELTYYCLACQRRISRLDPFWYDYNDYDRNTFSYRRTICTICLPPSLGIEHFSQLKPYLAQKFLDHDQND